jgi:hypothetical protein
MIRNLKMLVGPMLVLGAFAAIGASGAQAAEFHCSVEPCRYRLNIDGTGKTAHHVFVIDDKNTKESVAVTCPRITGEGTSVTKTFTEATVTNLNYNDEIEGKKCLIAGAVGATVNMMGCDYRFSAAGTVRVECPAGERIRIESATGCVYEVPAQGPLNGIGYLTTGVSPTREITVSVNVVGIAVSMTGTKAQCFLDPTHMFEGTYTTGNTKVTAESDPDEVMADGWWL